MTALTPSQVRRVLAQAPSRMLDAETSDRESRSLRVTNFSTDPLFYSNPSEYHLRTMRYGARVENGHFYVLES